MSEIKHSPGPFEYCPDIDWGMVRTADRKIVGQARHYISDEEAATHRRNGTDPFEGDARLWAAAPELLAACRAALTAEMLHETALDCGGDSAIHDAALGKFEAQLILKEAISKATQP